VDFTFPHHVLIISSLFLWPGAAIDGAWGEPHIFANIQRTTLWVFSQIGLTSQMMRLGKFWGRPWGAETIHHIVSVDEFSGKHGADSLTIHEFNIVQRLFDDFRESSKRSKARLFLQALNGQDVLRVWLQCVDFSWEAPGHLSYSYSGGVDNGTFPPPIFGKSLDSLGVHGVLPCLALLPLLAASPPLFSLWSLSYNTEQRSRKQSATRNTRKNMDTRKNCAEKTSPSILLYLAVSCCPMAVMVLNGPHPKSLAEAKLQRYHWVCFAAGEELNLR